MIRALEIAVWRRHRIIECWPQGQQGRLIEVKDLFEGEYEIVGAVAVCRLEKWDHLCLPTRIDGMVFHGGAALFEVVGLDVADNQAVGLQKERVIAPAGFAEGLEHLRPDLGMASSVLVHLFRADFE